MNMLYYFAQIMNCKKQTREDVFEIIDLSIESLLC